MNLRDSNNRHSSSMGSQAGHFFLKRVKKPKRFNLDPKHAEENPVYRVMKSQKQATNILKLILSNPDLGLKSVEKEKRSKTPYIDHQHQFASTEIYKKSQSVKQIESFKQKAVRIVAGTKKVIEQLQKSKRKINILDKFNKRVDKYCSYLPDTPEEQVNQSQKANDQLIRLCRHNFFPTEDLHKRAHSLLHYQEPNISLSKMKRLKDRVKTNSASRAAQRPIKKFLTLHV